MSSITNGEANGDGMEPEDGENSAKDSDKFMSSLGTFFGHRPGKPCTPMEYKTFKKTVKIVQNSYNVSSVKMATRVWLSLKGEAKTAVEDIDVDDILGSEGLGMIWERLDAIYDEVSIERADHANDEYWNCSRRPGENIDSYVLRLKNARRLLEHEDPGTVISDLSFAQRMLRRANLDREKRRLVVATIGGKYTSEGVHNALQMLFRGIEKDDMRRPRRWMPPSGGKGTGKGQQRRPFGRPPRALDAHMAEANDEDQMNSDETEESGSGSVDKEDHETGSEDEISEQDNPEWAAMAAEAFLAGFESAKNRASGKTKARGYKGEGRGSTSKPRTPEQIKKAKQNSKCASCGEYGHWHGDPECRMNDGANGKGGTGKGSSKFRTFEVQVMCNDGKASKPDQEMRDEDDRQ